MLTPQDLDRIQKKKVTEKIKQDLVAAAKAQIIGCQTDMKQYFSDNKQAQCSSCGSTVFLRPWLLELAEKYGIQIVCPNCVPSNEMRQQVARDLIEIIAEKPKGDFVI